MLGSDGKRARQSENGKRARQREIKKSERERARKEWERQRERRSLPHRFKKVRTKEGESFFYGKQKRKTSPEKQDKFFFWFSVDQFEFSIDSHFLTLPNTKKLVKSFTENVLRWFQRSLRLVYGILRPK